MKRIATILLILLATITAQAQVRSVSGTVVDMLDGQPLVGATVVALKLNSSDVDFSVGGTSADVDGRFSMSLPTTTQRIMVSYIGYKPQIIDVSGVDEPLMVQLEADAQNISEVVVTGYGDVERRKVTASVAKLNIDDAPRVAMSVDQMLAGQLSGVSVQAMSGAPGSAPKIRIRGTSSLNGTQDPLWVLDGIPLEGTDLPDLEENNIDQLYSSSIAGINPSDIENITVLKDAAATAIYGARAANGVIVITTKRGKHGRIRVNYSGKLAVVQNPSLDRLRLLNADQKVDLELALARSDYGYMSSKGAVARIIDAAGERSALQGGGVAALSSATQEQLDVLRSVNTDWASVLFRPALSHDHFLSLSGGGDNANYYFSAGYYDEKASTIGVGAQRYNITAKTEFRFTDRLKLGVSLFGNQRRNSSYLTTTTGFSNPLFYSRRANPYQQVYAADGSFAPDLDMQGYGQNAGDALAFNIVQERQSTSNVLDKKALNALFDLDLRIMEGLVYEMQLGLQYDLQEVESHSDPQSYATRYEREKGKLASGSFIPEGGILKNTATNAFQYTWKNMLRYRATLAEEHELEVMFGTEMRRNSEKITFSAAYGYDDNTLTIKPIIYPNETYATGTNFPLFRRNLYENAFVSFFATTSYTFRGRYTMGASIRYDGSNIFGVDPKYRYLPLYSVSVLWRVVDEPWMPQADWLSDLSLRASYGLQGNIDKSTSPKLVGEWKQNATLLPGGSEKNISVSAPPNEKLRWEKTASVNLGFDIALLRNRLKFSADYYHRRSNDLIGMKQLPLETGFDYATINWSSMSNSGVELNLMATPVKTERWQWNIGLNLAYNQNTVHKLTVRSDQRTPVGEGYPVGAVFVLPYAGLDQQGYPLIYNTNDDPVLISDLLSISMMGPSATRGLSAVDERRVYQYAGTDEAPYSGGLSTQLRFDGWELSLSAAANLGHRVLIRPYYDITRYDRGLNTSDHILSRWTPENPNGQYPRLISDKSNAQWTLPDGTTTTRYVATEYGAYNDFGYDKSLSLYLRNAGYVRLQSVRLAYSLPSSIISRWHIESLKIALEGTNLLVYGLDYDGFMDPETMKNPFAQPIPKTVTLSLNVGF